MLHQRIYICVYSHIRVHTTHEGNSSRELHLPHVTHVSIDMYIKNFCVVRSWCGVTLHMLIRSVKFGRNLIVTLSLT